MNETDIRIPFFLKAEEDWDAEDYDQATAAQEACIQDMCGQNNATDSSKLNKFIAVVVHCKDSSPDRERVARKILNRIGVRDRATIKKIIAAVKAA